MANKHRTSRSSYIRTGRFSRGTRLEDGLAEVLTLLDFVRQPLRAIVTSFSNPKQVIRFRLSGRAQKIQEAVSVVIPAFNDGEALGYVVDELHESFEEV